MIGNDLTTQALDLDLVDKLQTLPPFSYLNPLDFVELVAGTPLEHANTGDVLIVQGQRDQDYFVLLTGALEVSRSWVDKDGEQQATLAYVSPNTGIGEMAILDNLPRSASVRAIQPSIYIRISGNKMDELLARSQQFAAHLRADAHARRRMTIARQALNLRNLPFHQFVAVYQKMQSRAVAEGEQIITQGEKGDFYYVIEEGQAEVWRTDPLTDESACVALLGPSDGVGEEALLLEGLRNATVRMITPGKLLYIDKKTFDMALKAGKVSEINPREATLMVDSGEAVWLDCRYEMEYLDAHIPGAKPLALDQIREQGAVLDPKKTYIVYCRTGRRSACAVFLLAERGIPALSLTGGLSNWPFALERQTR